MPKTTIKANSKKVGTKWMPVGMIIFLSAGVQTEHVARYYETKFDTKEEANQYFVQASKKKYRIR